MKRACKVIFLAFTIISFKRDVFLPSNTNASHAEYETHRIKRPKCFFFLNIGKNIMFFDVCGLFDEQKENNDRLLTTW